MKKNLYSQSLIATFLLSIVAISNSVAQYTTPSPPAEAAVSTWQVVRGSQRLQGAQYMKGNYPNLPVPKWQATLTTANGGCEGDPVIGDVNNDGRNDVLVTTGNGYLMAFDGTTGALLWQRNGVSGQTSVAIGDANGDGLTDVVSVSDKVYLLDGANGNTIWSYTPVISGGTTIESCPNLGDLDHDGKVEVVVVVNDKIYAIDGQTGTQKWMYATGLPLTSFNGTAPAIGDVNGDGVLDVVASLQKSTNSPTNTLGAVLVAVDGATGSLLWSILVNNTNARSISAHFPAIGDVNGDCQLDVVYNSAAIRGNDGTTLWGTPASNGSRFSVIADLNNDCNVQVITSCSVLNATNGNVIWQRSSCSQYGWFAPAPRVGEFDPNSPGKEIIIAAAYQISGGVVVANPIPIQMFDGYTGTLIWGYDIATALNHTVEGIAVGDIDNDGCIELVIAPDCCGGANTLLALDDSGNTAHCGILASIGQVDFTGDSVSCTCINFNDFSSACANNWNWSFPGGSPSSSAAQNPGNVCYNTPGTYSVTMTARLNACSRTDTVIHSFVISSCATLPQAAFTSSDTAFCDETGKCLDFTDYSTGNVTSWQWFFAGATPDTSTQQNPTNICYYVPGTYPVRLIVSNGTGYDTLNATPLIIFATAPPPPVASSTGDTVWSTHSDFYQWFFNGNPISGATDSFYVATQTGTYSVRGTDNFGCTGLSNGVYVNISSVNGIINGEGIEIYPNPAKDEFTIYGLQFTAGATIELCTMLGESVYRVQINSGNSKPESVNCKPFPAGVYTLTITSNSRHMVYRVIVQH